MSDNRYEELIPDTAQEEFARIIGLEFGDISGDRVEGWIEVGPRHHQPNGIVHGGVHATVVETLASVGAAVWAYENLDGRVAVGLSNTTDFVRAHRTGRLDAVAEPLHRGRSQQLWDVRITRDDDGALVARGQVRLQNVQLDEIAGKG
jgi:1,4-dihydroxy-2-naphthoyl-CoA hydrolase